MVARPGRSVAVVLAVYVAGALVATAPAAGHLGTDLLSRLDTDVCSHVWGMWLTAETAAETGVPLFTRVDLIQYPDGGRLVSCTPLNDLLGLPLQALFGLVAAYNLVILGNLVLACLGAFLLARYLLRDDRGALVAGLVYGLSPFVLSFAVASGGSELVSTGYLPLALLFLLRTVRERGWRWPVLTALSVAAMDLTCVYYVSVFGLAAAGLLAYLGIAARSAAGDPVEGGDAAPGRPTRARLLRLAAAAGLSLVLAAPHLVVLSRALRSDESVLAEKMAGRRGGADRTSRGAGRGGDARAPGDGPRPGWALTPEEPFAPHGGGDLAAEGGTSGPVHDPRGTDPATLMATQGYSSVFAAHVFLPGRAGLQQVETICRFYLTPYAGWSALALAVLALVLVPRTRARWLWVAAFVGFLLIAMGPYLVVSERVHLGRPWSPVYWALRTLYPVHPRGHEAAYYLVSLLALGLLAGRGAGALLDRLPARWRLPGTGVLAAVVLADLVPLGSAPWPIPQEPLAVPQAYLDLAAARPDAAILEVPFYKGGTLLTNREKFCYQTVHGLPLADDLTGFLPAHLHDNPLVAELLFLELGGGRGTTPLARVEEGYASLAAAGFTHIVVDSRHYLPDAWNEVRPMLDYLAGAPVVYADGFAVYDLRPDGAVEGAPVAGERKGGRLKAADDIFNSGDLDGARAAYQEMLGTPLSPADLQVVELRLAKIAFLQGDADHAIQILEQRLEREGREDPAQADAMYELAKLYLRTGRLDDAHNLFGEITDRFYPAHKDRWGVHWAALRLAAFSARRGRPERALQAYDEILGDTAFLRRQERENTSHNAFYIQCFIAQDYRELGRAERALEVLDDLLVRYQMPEVQALARVERAKTLQRLGRREEAEAAYRQVLSVEEYLRHGRDYSYGDIVRFVDGPYGDEAWVRQLVQDFEAAIAPYEAAIPEDERRLGVTMPRPSDGIGPLSP